MANTWKVIHKDHSGNLLGEITPSELSFGMSLGNVGYVNYSLPLAHIMATRPFFEPYRTDFILERNGFQKLWNGIHTNEEINLEDRTLRVAGKDWLHYFERIIWPKDPNSNYRSTTAADATNGTVFDYTNNVFELAHRLMIQSTGLTDSLAWTTNYSYPTTFSTFRYQIQPGDTHTIAEHISEIFRLETGTAKPAVRPLNGVSYFAPSWYEYGSATPVVHTLEHGMNCEVLNFRNEGIQATRTFGIAQGLSSRKGYYAQHGTIGWYRRYDSVEEFSSVGAASNIMNLTNAASESNGAPHLEVNVRYVQPPTDSNFSFWETIRPGVRVRIRADLVSFILDQDLVVVSIEATVDEEGEENIVLTLDNAALLT